MRRRRSTIAPTHFHIIREPTNGNVYVRSHPDAADFTTLYGVCDPHRFNAHQDYAGADFSQKTDSQLQAPPSLSTFDMFDTLLRPLPRSLSSFGQTCAVLDMVAFKQRLRQLLEAGVDPRGGHSP